MAVLAALGFAAALAHPAQAAPPAHVALVIGNGSYAALPPLPGCLLSAHSVSAALRAAGFEVVEREDATSGGSDAAIGELNRQLTGAPGATAFAYVCAYATAFNGRTFLLPTSANISRPADVLTQGILAKSLLDTLKRGGSGVMLVALDIVPAPDAPAALGLDALLQGDANDGWGAIAVSQAKPSDTPTPLAAALVGALKGSTVEMAPLLTAVQQQLGGNKTVSIAAIQMPTARSYLVGAPPSPPVAAPPPAAAPPSAAAVSTAAAPAATPHSTLPSEEQMTDADRRRVQTALTRLGYYDGTVDGIFGPDTRAAIRRWQHELGIAMTGKLTAEQATRLAGG